MASQFPANASSLVELEIPDRTEPALPSGEWGINIAAVQGVNPDDGLKCQIQPWDEMEVGDKVVLLVDGIEVAHDEIDANEVNQRVTLFVEPWRLTDTELGNDVRSFRGFCNNPATENKKP